MHRYIVILLSFIFVNNCLAQDCVILLHALGRSCQSMSSMAHSLVKSNYIVVNQPYPTTRKPIEILAKQNVSEMVNECQKYKPKKIHFVTHSVGGVVLRAYLQNSKLANIGRIVMLAPPNHGSQLADLLQHNIIFQIITGPTGQELTTSKTSIPNILNQVTRFEIGIIAGNFSFNPFMKMIFHDENDGKVSVSSTRMKGMKDFLVLPVSHTFMTQNKLVIKEVSYFLENGKFNKDLAKKS